MVWNNWRGSPAEDQPLFNTREQAAAVGVDRAALGLKAPVRAPDL